ncbi:MAG TPA: sugar ABC transporter ATP-binding protein [Acidisoma sp.]|uniref:sugar ABC transporter ATP-binding protein n=1 Tax=Acidisoma sp. TaxID=1872115 RepID=UPI002CA1DD00|nr:sugar ABC transporter ATP-binding protein [Acidisoma sp.]HTI01750.1 sugar ABC transporter ATP-binding protein [Acidisoma sp.]
MAVKATGISKEFAGIQALNSVDITLKNGEIHALLGANGSGKSTLAKILTGVYQPEAGELHIGGRPVASIASPHQAARLGIAVVHQEAPLIDTMTVAEGVALFRGYPTRRGKVSWTRLYDETASMLHSFDVAVDPRQLAGTLSPAERALVAMVIALDQVKMGLELLILDEVTASLPENQAAVFLDRVATIAQAGTAVLMVTHRLAELQDRADSVTVLRDGRMVYTGPAGEADNRTLIDLMVGSETRQRAVAATGGGGGVSRLWAAADSAHAQRAPAVQGSCGTAETEIVLQARNLAGEFMRDVSFDMRRGEIVGVAGLIESGVSELPKILGGMSTRQSGVLKVRGRAVPLSATPRELIAAGVTLLPVDRLRSGGIASLSLTENALLPALSRYWHSNKREERVMGQLIKELDVRPSRSKALFGQLSGGNQQKVLLAKWLLLRPTVLVLEDPTSGVDPNARAKMFDILRDAAAEGVSILFFSTEPEQLAAMCSRVLILRNGIVAKELTGDELDQGVISRWSYA